MPAAVVTAEGHLVDSNLLTAIFDRIIERGGSFEVQHFELGRTNDEISRITGVSLSSVKSLIFRAKKALIECVRKKGIK